MSNTPFFPGTGHDLGLFHSIVLGIEAWGIWRNLEEAGIRPYPSLWDPPGSKQPLEGQVTRDLWALHCLHSLSALSSLPLPTLLPHMLVTAATINHSPCSLPLY